MGMLNSLNSLFTKFSTYIEENFVIDKHYYNSPNQQEIPTISIEHSKADAFGLFTNTHASRLCFFRSSVVR